MSLLFTILILIFIAIVVVNTIYSHLYDVVNMPSMPQTRKIIIDDIHSQKGLCEGLKIYDLGAGWGGLCRKIASCFPHASITGYEISPVPFFVAKMVSLCGSYTIKRTNLFQADIHDADIIVCYLSPRHMKPLADKIKAECKKGTILYSQGFPIPDMDAHNTIDIPYSLEKKLYRYQF